MSYHNSDQAILTSGSGCVSGNPFFGSNLGDRRVTQQMSMNQNLGQNHFNGFQIMPMQSPIGSLPQMPDNINFRLNPSMYMQAPMALGSLSQVPNKISLGSNPNISTSSNQNFACSRGNVSKNSAPMIRSENYLPNNIAQNMLAGSLGILPHSGKGNFIGTKMPGGALSINQKEVPDNEPHMMAATNARQQALMAAAARQEEGMPSSLHGQAAPFPQFSAPLSSQPILGIPPSGPWGLYPYFIETSEINKRLGHNSHMMEPGELVNVMKKRKRA